MEAWHMNGAGNDFLVIDAREKRLALSDMARALCAAYGADGFMAVDTSQKADVRLHFYNSDGSRGEMCGNGSRCVCRFAYEHGIAGEHMLIEADAGLVPGWRLSQSQYRVQLNSPQILQLNCKPDVAYVELGCPGLPHAVVEVPGLSWQQRDALRERAKQLRFNPAFARGANVNFYTWLDEGHIRILSYERGVEDYTLACGTGTGATAAVLWMQGKLPGGDLIADNPGGQLRVHVGGGRQGQSMKLLLDGPTEVTQILEI